MLKINTKLTRNTKKLNIVNVENNERREVEIFKIKVIDEKMSSRSRKFKIQK